MAGREKRPLGALFGLRHAHTRQDEFIYKVGDRSPGDAASYPDDDIQALLVDGAWRFTHKDGSPY